MFRAKVAKSKSDNDIHEVLTRISDSDGIIKTPNLVEEIPVDEVVKAFSELKSSIKAPNKPISVLPVETPTITPPTPTVPTITPPTLTVPTITPRDKIDSTSEPQTEMKRLIVGRGISVRGKISACDKLIIEGNLEAELENCGTVEVSESGTFKGDAEIAQAKISGQFEGSLTVRERLLVRTTGRVSGTVRYGRLHIEDGGEINGDVKSLGTVSPKYTAQAEQSPKADLAEVREARRFSLMITTAQRAQLKTRGYNDAAIDEMTPELAHRTLGLYS